MGAIMNWADIALSSGSRTVYELAATGTATVVIAQNDGEVERMKLLRRQGIIDFLGNGQDVDMEIVSNRIFDLARDVDPRGLVSERGQEVVDGEGVNRILDLVYEILVG
jgi:spore coat polysaccharide biosynthesis predicted glycosyltransferase SpsG